MSIPTKSKSFAWIPMTARNRCISILALSLLALLVAPQGARAQEEPKFEAGADYNYVRTNAPPGGCGCISLNGGDGWISYNVRGAISAVAQVSTQHASNIEGSDADLRFTSFLFGPRYSRSVSQRAMPFLQVLFGGVHASGSLAPGTPGIGGSANAFAMTAGGGLDIKVTRYLSVRAIQADYYLTLLNNGANDRQNNLRLSAGLVLRWSR